MSRTATIFLLFASAAIAAVRLAGVKHEAFQAVSHLFIGALIGGQIAISGFGERWVDGMHMETPRTAFNLLLALTVLLSAVELLAAFVLYPVFPR